MNKTAKQNATILIIFAVVLFLVIMFPTWCHGQALGGGGQMTMGDKGTPAEEVQKEEKAPVDHAPKSQIQPPAQQKEEWIFLGLDKRSWIGFGAIIASASIIIVGFWLWLRRGSGYDFPVSPKGTARDFSSPPERKFALNKRVLILIIIAVVLVAVYLIFNMR